LREFLILAAYLYVCFAALAAFKAAILQTEGISFAPWAFAAIKALRSVPQILIGRTHLWNRRGPCKQASADLFNTL
jgi:hypothetical protein